MKNKKTVLTLGVLLTACFLAGTLIKRNVFFISRVQGHSMEPNLSSGDIIFVERLTNDFFPNDIVVVKPGTLDTDPKNSVHFIKRVVAGPNSNLYIDDYKLFINNQLVTEQGQYSVIWKHRSFACRYSDEYVTRPNEYFVLGDNRCDALDSRHFGGLTRNDILGKVIFKF